MKKFKEILFLKNLKGVGKAKIYKNYWDNLKSSDIGELFDEMLKYDFKEDKLNDAKLKAEKIYNYIINNNEIDVITVFDDDYPEKLKDMENKRPLYLYVKGNKEALFKPNLTVIGTRKPSEESAIFEEKLVKGVLDISDRVVISGLALGCDKIAHETTVNENKVTVAVLPSGVNVIKPAKHKKLAQDILDNGGCLVSEYEPNANAFKSTYVDRDHIVAALSDVTFIPEFGEKSGTRHTVDAILKYNKKDNFKRELYIYLPEDADEEAYSGNIYLSDNRLANEATDIEEFCEEIAILDDKPAKTVKKDKQSTLGF